MKTLLSVNVNKLATLRNSRGKNNPDVVQTALKIISYGAHGITVHPRPDERHIRRADVIALKKTIKVELNVEGYPSQDFLELIEEVRPAQVTLVPDPPDAITSNAGWALANNEKYLQEVTRRIQKTKARVSIFMDPKDFTSTTVQDLKDIGCERIELYTEDYAQDFSTPKKDATTKTYLALAKAAHKAGIGINAGHDLDRANLKYLVKKIPFIDEVSIGHALICDALELGLERTVKEYLACLKH